MHSWARECTRGDYKHRNAGNGLRDAARWCFRREDIAAAFHDVFGGELIVIPDDSA